MSESHGGETHLMACRLKRLLTPAALGRDDGRDRYGREAEDLQRRRIEFLTCMLRRSGAPATYDFRIICTPNPGQPSSGNVALLLLIRLDETSDTESIEYVRQCLRLLEAFFPEGEWELLDAASTLAAAHPFEVADVVRIGRRLARITPDSLIQPAKPVTVLGLRSAASSSVVAEPGTDVEGLLHLFPFLPGARSLHQVCQLLLLQTARIALSVRFRPTSLTEQEGAFLESQVVTCERLVQAPRDADSEFPVLRQFANLSLEHQSRRLLSLRAGAAHVQIELASSGPLPPLLIEAVGTAFSQAANGAAGRAADAGLASHFVGGYETARVGEIREAALHFSTANIPTAVAPANLALDTGRLRFLFGIAELADVVLLPPTPAPSFPGIDSKGWRTVPAPAQLPESGVRIGVSEEHGISRPVRLAWPDRLRHLYVIGQTGTGKSTLLLGQILDDIASGAGVCVLDPHGDLFHDVVGRIPADRIDDVILIDPTDPDFTVGLNPLENSSPAQRYFIAQNMVDVIYRLVRDDYGAVAAGTMLGPAFQQHVKMNLVLLMSEPTRPASLLDFYMLFQAKDYWRKWVPTETKDPLLSSWIETVLPKWDYQKQGDGPSWGVYLSSKFEPFLFDPMLRHIFGQRSSSVDLSSALNEGKIVLVNLAKGELSEGASRFFGMILLSMLLTATLARSSKERADRRPFYLYVDEFQSVATEGFVTLLSEGRKFGIGVTLANQFLSQIDDRKIVDAIFGNVGSLVSFRLGPQDAEMVERRFVPVFGKTDFVKLPNRHASVSLSFQNQLLEPFSVRTVAVSQPFSQETADQAVSRSRAAFSRPREQVDEEITKVMEPPI